MMMTSLFSSFDPTSSMSFLPNWMSAILIILMFPQKKWIIQSKMNMLFNKLSKTIHSESKTLASSTYNPGSSLIMLTLMMFIMTNNLLGLIPFIFTATSHILITLSMALPMWLAMMLYGWINSTMIMFSHLVPLGTPPALMMFMVMIETISNIIRPITLSVRLMANMIAGHLLMTLMGNQGNNVTNIMLPMLLSAQVLLIVLETAVATIQAYVFTTLTSLYSSEVN